MARDAPGVGDSDFVLRGWRDDDALSVFEARQDAALQRFLAGAPTPFTMDDAERYVRFDIAQPDRFVIAEPSNEALLGSIWLDQPRGVFEVGFWLAPKARGRGIATSAVLRLVDWAKKERSAAEIEMVIHPANAAARTVANKAGFVDAGEVEYGEWPDGQTRGARYVWRSAP